MLLLHYYYCITAFIGAAACSMSIVSSRKASAKVSYNPALHLLFALWRVEARAPQPRPQPLTLTDNCMGALQLRYKVPLQLNYNHAATASYNGI